MYEDQTYDSILARMLANISNDIDKREGSVAFDMLAPKAAELAMSYIELNNVANLGFAETTYGEYLDMKAGEYGIIRKQPIKSVGTITLTGTDGLIIPLGTAAYTDSGVRFLTDTEVTITLGTATVTVTAEEAGVSSNIPANSIINIEIDSVTCNNGLSTYGGTDLETDEALLKRYLDKARLPVVSGNANHYRAWALEVTGIGDAKVIPTWNGPGTVKVVIINTGKGIVEQVKVDEVSQYIEDNRPIGATVTVQSAKGKNIDISASLVLSNSFILSDVQTKITDDINNYLKLAAFVDTDIKYSKIGTIILGVNGVLDYSNLTLNGGTSNIPLADDETPILGVVTLS